MSTHLYAVYIGCIGSVTYCASYSTVWSTYVHACMLLCSCYHELILFSIKFGWSLVVL